MSFKSVHTTKMDSWYHQELIIVVRSNHCYLLLIPFWYTVWFIMSHTVCGCGWLVYGAWVRWWSECCVILSLQQVRALEFHPKVSVLVSASSDCTVKFFDYSKTNIKRAYHVIQVCIVCMCVCVCVCVHVYVCVCLYLPFIYLSVSVSMCACTCMCAYMCVCIACVNAYVCI